MSAPQSTITTGDIERFSRHFRRKRPLFMPGHAAGWPAVERWTFSALAERAGERTAATEVGSVLLDEPEVHHVSLRGYMERLRDGWVVEPGESIEYLALYDFFDAFPELARDVDFTPLIERTVWHKMFGWVGPGGTDTSFHIDWVDNLFVQVRGRKRLTLIDPAHSAAMAASERFDYRATVSSVDPRAPEGWPAFAAVEKTVLELSAGDALYIPRGWWHRAEGLEASISVNAFGHTLWGAAFYQTRATAQRWLHDRGLYRTGACTCHRVDDAGRRVPIQWA